MNWKKGQFLGNSR